MAIKNTLLGGTDNVNGDIIDADDVNDTNDAIITTYMELNSQRYGDSVISGCEVTEQGTPDQTVAVASGKILIGGLYYDVSADAVLNLSAADGSDPRWDLISVDSNDTLTVTDGTAAANPSVPTLPTDETPLATIYRAANDDIINEVDIKDCRRLIDTKYTYTNNSLIKGYAGTKSVEIPAYRCQKYIKIHWNLGSKIYPNGIHDDYNNNTTGRIQVTISGSSTTTVQTLEPDYTTDGGEDVIYTQTLTSTIYLDPTSYDFTEQITITVNNLTRNLNFTGGSDLYSVNSLFSIEGE